MQSISNTHQGGSLSAKMADAILSAPRADLYKHTSCTGFPQGVPPKTVGGGLPKWACGHPALHPGQALPCARPAPTRLPRERPRALESPLPLPRRALSAGRSRPGASSQPPLGLKPPSASMARLG